MRRLFILDGQRLAAFGAARLEYALAVVAAHTAAEAVDARAAAGLGLVSTFWHLMLLISATILL